MVTKSVISLFLLFSNNDGDHIRRQGESLHALRDDILEKVSIVYGHKSEQEQEAHAVEVFRPLRCKAGAKSVKHKPPVQSMIFDS